LDLVFALGGIKIGQEWVRVYILAESVSFQGGTLVLYNIEQEAALPAPFQWIKGHWRCEGYHYPSLIPWFKEQNIRDTVPRWERLKLTLHDLREPHSYQDEALVAWKEAGWRGSIVLPTGAGKTFVAIHAIHEVKRSALIVAPTIDLLHQWYARLVNAFKMDIGVYYGGEKIIQPLTVTTYHSAGDLIDGYGSNFKLIIFDEVHHLPAPNWGETALMSPSPFRLGLTATYPEEWEQQNGRWRVDDLIGGIVYSLAIDDLAGEQLAAYRTERVRIDLTDAEREQYERDFAVYSGFFRSRQLQKTHGKFWLMEMMRLSSFDPDARRALLARQRMQKLLANAGGKFEVLESLLREYAHEQVLVFTESNAVAYAISRRHLIPVITHETKAEERKFVLESFQNGHYKAIVTSKVLDEGVDVPEAKIAIVLGGSASARQYVQRLGRVLRKAGNREAVLFDVFARNTIEESKSQRRSRRPHAHG
jgi:superfamily II DNA or RNA helicase